MDLTRILQYHILVTAESFVGPEPDAIDIESFSQNQTYTSLVQMENGCEEHSPQSLQSPAKSPPTQEAFADTTSKTKVVSFPPLSHNSFSTSTLNASFSSSSPVSLKLI